MIVIILYFLILSNFSLVVFLFKKRKINLAIVFLIILFLFIDAAIIEPYRLTVNQEKIEFKNNNGIKANIIIFSDLHLGQFTKKSILRRVVKKTNELKPDLVLIPGDFINKPNLVDLSNLFQEFKNIKAPIFAVAGNHDSEHPGNIPSGVVRDVIGKYNVNFIDNQVEKIKLKEKEITLIGLSDLFEGRADYGILNGVKENESVIILAHNPDAAYELPNWRADLLVAGHTHGGQIRIPFLYKYTIPTVHDFDKGWYFFDKMKLFITSGVGTSGLPFRFLNPPEIVQMELIY